jgi:hypothetical protein
MSIVVLQLPDVKRKSEIRPRECRYCHGETFQRWGVVKKPVKDNRYRKVDMYRYRCCHSRRTFRHYPAGVDQADQTQRLRKLAALMWVLGLSLRGACLVLGAFGIKLSHMSVWRDIQEQAGLQHRRRQWLQSRVLGLDGAYVRCGGKTRPVLVAVDLGRCEPVAPGYVDEHDPRAVMRFLKPLVQRLGISVIVTDDLVSYKVVAQKLDVEHQICQFHVRRWVGRMLHQLRDTVPKEWLWVLEEIKQLLAELPLEGSRRLFELWKQIPERRIGQVGERSPLELLRYL